MQKKIAKDYRTEFLNGLCKSLIGVVGRDCFLQFGLKARVDGFTRCLARFEVRPQCAQRSGRLIRLAEGDVKGRNFGVAIVQRVEQVGEMHTGERPFAEDFLGMLIDVDNYDAWVNRCGTGRTIAKTGIERGEFQTLQEVQNGCGAVSKKGEVVERQRGNGDAQTDQKRGAVLPPGDEQ